MQRRDFLSSMALGASLLVPVGRSGWAATGAASGTGGTNAAQHHDDQFLARGAVDGLNVVAPVGDANYRRLRPTIGLELPGLDGGALDLDGYFGLHPALAPLMPLWQQKRLAFVHASGSPDESRSHFDAQIYMENATPGRKNTPDGWMNRLVAALPGEAAASRAVSIGPLMPRILSGAAPALILPNGAGGTKADVLDRPAVGAAFDQLYASHARFGRAYSEGRAAHREVMQAAMSQEMQAADNGAPLPNGFPDDAARLAGLMRSDARMQVAFIALGGWDTHANQGAATGQLANRLAPVGLGLATLAQRLGPLFEHTTIVVMSEFGRTARQNGNAGTDHGHGNAMWVLGGRVAGGKVYSDWQGVGDEALNEGRDLPVTTDFRAVLAQVAEKHLRLPDGQLATLFPEMPRKALGFQLLQA